MSLQLSQIGEAEPTADVLIVGSGPAGLFAACEFVRHGVKPRVVERRLAPHHEARGTALQPARARIRLNMPLWTMWPYSRSLTRPSPISRPSWQSQRHAYRGEICG